MHQSFFLLGCSKWKRKIAAFLQYLAFLLFWQETIDKMGVTLEIYHLTNNLMRERWRRNTWLPDLANSCISLFFKLLQKAYKHQGSSPFHHCWGETIYLCLSKQTCLRWLLSKHILSLLSNPKWPYFLDTRMQQKSIFWFVARNLLGCLPKLSLFGGSLSLLNSGVGGCFISKSCLLCIQFLSLVSFHHLIYF